MNVSHALITLATFNGVTGVVWGATAAYLSKHIARDAVSAWRWICLVGHRFHIKQTAMDDAALRAIGAARPAINQALDQAEAHLTVERAAAAAMEADTTPQTGSLMTKPVDADPLPAPAIAAVAVVAAP